MRFKITGEHCFEFCIESLYKEIPHAAELKDLAFTTQLIPSKRSLSLNTLTRWGAGETEKFREDQNLLVSKNQRL